jgi:hypothetical protein
MSRRISFGRDDVTVVDWNSAIVIDPEAEDIIAILEFANVELMEMRNLDYRLDNALTLAYETLSKRPWGRFPFGADPAQLQRVAQWQVDSAILFEGVNNALKLVGDQYLARLYRAATDRFHMGGVGRNHHSQAGDSGWNLRQNLRYGDGPPHGAAGVDCHRTHCRGNRHAIFRSVLWALRNFFKRGPCQD